MQQYLKRNRNEKKQAEELAELKEELETLKENREQIQREDDMDSEVIMNLKRGITQNQRNKEQ